MEQLHEGCLRRLKSPRLRPRADRLPNSGHAAALCFVAHQTRPVAGIHEAGHAVHRSRTGAPSPELPLSAPFSLASTPATRPTEPT
eukprot:11217281-Lingulodinium_polyedra.AAC.1